MCYMCIHNEIGWPAFCACSANKENIKKAMMVMCDAYFYKKALEQISLDDTDSPAVVNF